MVLAASTVRLLTAPWGEEIMVRALAEVALLGVAGGVLGCWVVLYGLSYSAESLAHSLFPGLVLAALAGIPLLVGGAGAALVAALAMAAVGGVPGLGRDTAVAVVITPLLGLGALLALSPASPPGIQALLFGDILGTSGSDVLLAAGVVLLVLASLRLLHGRLLIVGFDRSGARSLGVPPLLADAALLLLVALVIVVAVKGLGNLLVVAVLVGPAATARLLARRLASMMALAAGLAVASGAAGLYLSYYAGTAAGASIAGTTVGLYLAVAALARARVALAGVAVNRALRA